MFPIFPDIVSYRGVEGGALGALIACFIVFWIVIARLYYPCADKVISLIYPQLLTKRGDATLLGGFPINTNGWSKCWTYGYFILMAILAGLWFVVMTLEHLIYRKTGNCNDINVSDNYFTCFNLKNGSEKIDCTSEETLHAEIEVFCYLYEFRFSAVAIGFSTYNFILFLTVLYFKLVVQCLHTRGNKRKCLQVCNCIYAIVVIVIILTVSTGLHYSGVLHAYFFEGTAVLRVAIFILLIITTGVGILTPWYHFVKMTGANGKGGANGQEGERKGLVNVMGNPNGKDEEEVEDPDDEERGDTLS